MALAAATVEAQDRTHCPTAIRSEAGSRPAVAALPAAAARDAPRWPEMARDEPRSVEMNRDEPRCAEMCCALTCRAVLLLAIPPVYEELVARLVVGQAQERTLLIRPCVLML